MMKTLIAFLIVGAIGIFTMTLTSNDAPAEFDVNQISSSTILLKDASGIVKEYESLDDAAFLTDIPDSVILESILSGKKIEGYEFTYK